MGHSPTWPVALGNLTFHDHDGRINRSGINRHNNSPRSIDKKEEQYELPIPSIHVSAGPATTRYRQIVRPLFVSRKMLVLNQDKRFSFSVYDVVLDPRQVCFLHHFPVLY